MFLWICGTPKCNVGREGSPECVQIFTVKRNWCGGRRLGKYDSALFPVQELGKWSGGSRGSSSSGVRGCNNVNGSKDSGSICYWTETAAVVGVRHCTIKHPRSLQKVKERSRPTNHSFRCCSRGSNGAIHPLWCRDTTVLCCAVFILCALVEAQEQNGVVCCVGYSFKRSRHKMYTIDLCKR